MNNILSYLRIPAIATSSFAALASGLLYFKQNEIIYPRNIPADSRTNLLRPSSFNIADWTELSLKTPDNESLNAFLIRPTNKAQSKPLTILMFHGNAGNIGHRIPIAQVLEVSLGCTVLMLEYRGYGTSTGTPDEKGLAIDAQTGLDFIRSCEELKGHRIVIYGQSLGGAVATQLVVNNQEQGDIKALLLENTFTSIRDIIPAAFPPAKYLARLCHQFWPTRDIIGKIRSIPILFLSGLQDEIVPPTQMAELYAQATTSKTWKEFPFGHHNDTVAEDGYFQAIAEFIDEEVWLGGGEKKTEKVGTS